MTFTQALSLVLLAAVLVVAIWRRSNIGVLALGAAFVVVEAHGGDVSANVDTMYESFPGNLVVLIAGVSLLFAHLERSGALGWLVDAVFRIVGARTALLPWACFVIAAALSSMGAFSTAPIALLVPVIARVAGKYPRHFYVMELAAIIGANSAGLSPLNPTGTAVSDAAAKADLHYDKWGLWAVSMTAAVVVVLALQLLERVRAAQGRPAFATPAAGPVAEQGRSPDRVYRAVAGLALVAFVVGVVGFDTDVGLTAILLAVVMQILFRGDEVELLARVPWNSILLLAGLLTYLGLMQDIGTTKAIQTELVQHVHSVTLLVLVVSYLTALLCNIESSTLGVLGLMMTLVTSLFATSGGFFWIVCAVAVPAALMVMNPIHVAGTLIIANAEPEQQQPLFRNLLTVAVCCLIVAPAVFGGIAMANV